MDIGYVGGVFDLFHIGHVNILRRARGLCDRLIVGVSTDELSAKKIRKCVIPFEERIKVVKSCKYANVVVPQETHNKIYIQNMLKFNMLFVGDDQYNTENWVMYEKRLKQKGVKTIYFPYTPGTSSTLINKTLGKLRSE